MEPCKMASVTWRRHEASTLGLEGIEVDVIQDPRRGLLAKVHVRAGQEEELAKALGRYSFQTDWV
ncbi:hypothetical protein D9M68_887310 [compost metagenome]